MTDEMKQFWHDRLTDDQTLVATGHRAFNLSYNQALYQMQADTLDTLLQMNQVSLLQKRALDLGSGLGFFINYFLNRNVKAVTGIDIAPSSITYLQQFFPDSQFYCADIGTVDTLPVAEQFDIVSIISVLYHIVEENAFEQALKNVCRAIAPGGYLIVSDMFQPSMQFTAGHVVFRGLDAYQPIFQAFNLEVVDSLPMYYFMNRTYIPYLAPPVLSLKPVTQMLMALDKKLRHRRFRWGAGLKMLLAQRVLS